MAPGTELFLIDGNSLAYRAFFALPGGHRDLRRAADERDLRLRLDDGQDPHRAPAEGRSSSSGTRGCRGARTSYEPYKAQRKPRPDLLKEQWPHIPAPLAEAFGFTNVRVEGYEADDVIAALARAGPATRGSR